MKCFGGFPVLKWLTMITFQAFKLDWLNLFLDVWSFVLSVLEMLLKVKQLRCLKVHDYFIQKLSEMFLDLLLSHLLNNYQSWFLCLKRLLITKEISHGNSIYIKQQETLDNFWRIKLYPMGSWYHSEKISNMNKIVSILIFSTSFNYISELYWYPRF